MAMRNDTGIGTRVASDEDVARAMARLMDIAMWTKTAPPARVLDEEGAPTDEFLAYCEDTGLSLDWIFSGDVMPMVMGNFHHAQKKRKERVWFDRANTYEAGLGDLANLSEALQMAVHHFGGDSIEDQGLRDTRAAIIGVANAIHARVKLALEEEEAMA